ncbi:MAG: coproporphyrinogen oxidase [Caulobacter sp.]|nr:coproporphyrinogen oxidase [Caulobacter sp.]
MTNSNPLGVYIHWPYCARICPYCDFNVVRDRAQAEQPLLARAIIADLKAQRALTGPRRLASIFLGGGTPSLMDPAWAAQIIDAAKALWTPEPDLEISLEANPTDAESGRFAAFAEAGVARLSLGVQALDDASLAFLGRNHDAAAARRAAETAARLFPRLSIDLIYARPGQSADAWRAELDQAIAWGAEHISPYQLTIEAATAFGRAVARGTLIPPGEDLASDLFDVTQQGLEAAGFDAYEVSNHAKGQAARSRHNLVYWRGWDYVGVGPGAHGRLTLPSNTPLIPAKAGTHTESEEDARQQSLPNDPMDPDFRREERRVGTSRIATTAHAKVADYLRAVNETGVGFTSETLSPIEAAEERILLGLRIDHGVAFAEIAALGLTPTHPAVTQLVDGGYLLDDPARLRATRAGRLVLDRLTADLILGAA